MRESTRLLGLKILLAAGVAAFVVWRYFYRKKQEDDPPEAAAERRAACQDISVQVVTGPGASQTISASYLGAPVSIGRMPHCVLPITDPKVSGDHALISWDPEEKQWILVDAGSTNGTKLNDVLISLPNRQASKPHVLQDGDIITIADEVVLQVALHPAGAVPSNSSGKSSHEVSQVSKGAQIVPVGPQSGTVSLCTETTARGPRSEGTNTIQPPPSPKPQVVEYCFPGLEAVLALASQVGSHHWHQDQGSDDVCFWNVPFGKFKKAGLFGVCDGHFGPGAALDVQQNLPEALSAELDDDCDRLIGNNGCDHALLRAFEATDARLKTEAGTTTTLLLAERRADGGIVLQASNVGDSAALLIDPVRHSYKKMTADHRVSAPAETRRLLEKGTPLTHNNTRMYMLNLARAMGDSTFKEMDIGLIAEPHVSPVYHLPPEQSVIVVMASDGLWDAVNEKEVVSGVIRLVSNAGAAVKDVAHGLLTVAVDRGASDDVSVCVVQF